MMIFKSSWTRLRRNRLKTATISLTPLRSTSSPTGEPRSILSHSSERLSARRTEWTFGGSAAAKLPVHELIRPMDVYCCSCLLPSLLHLATTTCGLVGRQRLGEVKQKGRGRRRRSNPHGSSRKKPTHTH